VSIDDATPQPPGHQPTPPSAEALHRVANDVHAELVAAGFEPHTFLGTEETADDWRRRGPLTVIRRDHVEVWWSIGPRPRTQAGPSDAERRMTPVLRDILQAAGIDADLSIPTREGDVTVWITTHNRPDDPVLPARPRSHRAVGPGRGVSRSG
jgi:hypothetical protein